MKNKFASAVHACMRAVHAMMRAVFALLVACLFVPVALSYLARGKMLEACIACACGLYLGTLLAARED